MATRFQSEDAAMSKFKKTFQLTYPNAAGAGSRYFCESFYGHPCPTSGKNHATANACGSPSRPVSFVATQQGVRNMFSQ